MWLLEAGDEQQQALEQIQEQYRDVTFEDSMALREDYLHARST